MNSEYFKCVGYSQLIRVKATLDEFPFNLLLPNGNYSYLIIKISFCFRITKQISYERRIYESVDDESLS